jgi:hypothetical protein
MASLIVLYFLLSHWVMTVILATWEAEIRRISISRITRQDYVWLKG